MNWLLVAGILAFLILSATSLLIFVFSVGIAADEMHRDFFGEGTDS